MGIQRIYKVTLLYVVTAIASLALLPPTLGAAPLDGRKLLEPNPVTDWVAAKIRDGIIKRLDLSGSQLASIQDVIDKHREDLLADAIAVKEARMTLMNEVRAEELEVEAIRRAHADASAAELELWLRAGGILQEMRPILTPEQRQEAELLVEELLESAELRFDDLESKFAAGELLGKKWLARAAKASSD